MPAKRLNCDAANRFLLDDLTRNRDCHGLLIIRPTDDPARIEAQLAENDRLRGFKVYHLFASREDTQNAEAQEYIPEWAWEMANSRGLCIMLHIVRQRSLADPCNQRYIREHCTRYPNARLILAHAARGFCGAHTVEGIESVRGLENVWFDTSAVCDAHAMEAILDVFGPSRLLYGSDFPISEMRGRPVSIGDGFCWIYHDTVDLRNWTLGNPTLCGIESLLALRQACQTKQLSDADVEQIFCHNASALLTEL